MRARIRAICTGAPGLQLSPLLLGLLLSPIAVAESVVLRGTGDIAVIVERADGALIIGEHTSDKRLGAVEGLGDLSHASVVFSRDTRYAFVFGRDGGLSKVDLLSLSLERRIQQAGNSIGGAISTDGRLVAVSNYEPGGVRVFDTASLEAVADIPASDSKGRSSKVVGLVDAPGNRFVFSLFDAGEIWLLDMSDPTKPEVQRYTEVGQGPYDALLTPDGRYYIAGLFGEKGFAVLDLWHPEKGTRKILENYGSDAPDLPVYKMPHLEGWAVAGQHAFVPAVGQHEVLVFDMNTWTLVDRIRVGGQPVFVIARPGGRQVWVNFALPDNDRIQILDTESRRVVQTLTPGAGVLHMEFTARGDKVWVSVRDENRVSVYDAESRDELATLSARAPSGIFFSYRAHRMGL